MAGYLQPKNLLLTVLDNEQYASTGGQSTFSTRRDLAAIAAGGPGYLGRPIQPLVGYQFRNPSNRLMNLAAHAMIDPNRF